MRLEIQEAILIIEDLLHERRNGMCFDSDKTENALYMAIQALKRFEIAEKKSVIRFLANLSVEKGEELEESSSEGEGVKYCLREDIKSIDHVIRILKE